MENNKNEVELLFWYMAFCYFFNIGPVGKCLREIADKKGKYESEWNEKCRCINEWNEWKC